MKRRIVVDTNIFVSALLGARNASRTVIHHCLEGRYQPLMGNALFNEYNSLLGRTKLFEKCSLEHEQRIELFEAFLSVCKWIEIYFLWRPNLRDEGDNHLIELAVAGGAKNIITNNIKDFRRAELLFPEINIQRPENFLARGSSL